MALAIDDFSRKWLGGLRFRSPAGLLDKDRNLVVAELTDLGYLKHYDMDLQRLAPILTREAAIYDRYRKALPQINRDLRDATRVLNDAARTIEGQAHAMRHRISRQDVGAIATPLSTAAAFLNTIKQGLETLTSGWWQGVLNKYPATDQEVLDAKYLELSGDGDLATFQPIIEDPHPWLADASLGAPIGRNPIRSLDLDDRFQRRVEYFLRSHLQGISLRGASRLVVLTYICAGVAREQGGNLVLSDLKTKLTPDGVYRRLRRVKSKN